MDIVGNVQLVAGNSGTIDGIMELLQATGERTRGNPDLYMREYASFGVEEARDIAARASSRAIASPRRTFVIVTPTMTSEAQNALLKTFEEPAGDARFFLVVPSPQMLLSTLRSRAQILDIGGRTQEATVDPRVFLQAKPSERLDMLKPFLDKDEDDKRDLASSIVFLAALEHELSHDVTKHTDGLEAVYRARKYIGDKGSLTKALLEQVALLI